MGSKQTGKIKRMEKEGTIQDSVEPSAEELYSGIFHPPRPPAENFSVLEICVPFGLRNWQRNLDFQVELDEILKKVKQRHKTAILGD